MGEHDRQRSEPSISESGIDGLDRQEAGTPVDLDALLDEINNSRAYTAAPSVRPYDDHQAPPLPSAAAEIPFIMPHEQPLLDFGESEPHMEGARQQLDDANDNLKGEAPMSRGVLMAGGALVVLSLLCGVAGLFVAFSASGKIEAMQQSVDALQTRLATMQVSGDPRVGQLQAEQAGLTSRLDELTMKMEALVLTPAKGGDSQLTDVRKRLEALERKVSARGAGTAAADSTSVKKTSVKAPSSGDWTVVLVSFPTAAQAESERARLKKAGMSSEVFRSQVEGKTWYRVRVPGYASQEAAKAAIPALQAKAGIEGAWVAHR